MTRDVLLVSEQEPSYILVPSPTVTADLVTHTDYVVYIPLATRETYGSVKIGDGLLINDGVLSLDTDEIPILSISKNGELIYPDENKNVNISLTKSDVGLSQVDNTSDKEKPVSDLQQIELDIKLNKNLGSENYNKLLYVDALGNVALKKTSFEVDYEMSDLSENAVANRVIKKYVDENGGKLDGVILDGVLQEIEDKKVLLNLQDYTKLIETNALKTFVEEQLAQTNSKFSQYAKLEANQTFIGGQTIVGNLTIEGDVIQNGDQYITSAEKVETEDDYILMRKGATGSLGSGYSGFEVENYNGNGDNARLVVDSEGTARVGDIGDEQPLLTREETSDLTDGEVLVWNATTNRAEGSADYVKNTDYASFNDAGVVKVNPNDGIGIGNTTKNLYVSPANQTEISAKTSTRKPIVPNTLDYSVKVGVTTNTIELTETEKSNATNWLGAVKQVEYSKDQTFADGSDAGVIGRLYMRFRDNTENSIVAHCQGIKYTVPVRDSASNFYVGNPTQILHTTNKRYVDGLIEEVKNSLPTVTRLI